MEEFVEEFGGVLVTILFGMIILNVFASVLTVWRHGFL